MNNFSDGKRRIHITKIWILRFLNQASMFAVQINKILFKVILKAYLLFSEFQDLQVRLHSIWQFPTADLQPCILESS